MDRIDRGILDLLQRDATLGVAERCEGDGTWADLPTSGSFTVTLTIVCPTRTFTESQRLWHFANAIGRLYERVSF